MNTCILAYFTHWGLMRGAFFRVVFPPNTTKFLSKIRIFLINSTDFQKSTNIGKFYIAHKKNYFISWQIISFSNTLPSWTKVSYIITKFTNRVKLIPKLHEKVLKKDWYITRLDIINNSKIQKHVLKDACKKRYIKVKSTITRYVKFCCFFIMFFFHRHWRFTGQQRKLGDYLLLHSTNSTLTDIEIFICNFASEMTITDFQSQRLGLPDYYSMRFTTLSNYHLIYWLAMQY